MIGLGTLVNVICVLVGGFVGVFAGRFVNQSMQDTLMKGTGISVLFIGMAGTLQQMFYIDDAGSLKSGGTMILILSIAIGTVLGELLHIEEHIEKLGNWLKIKTGNAKDKLFVEGFVNTSLTICIGAMAVVGSIQDGIFGDHAILVAKGILDLIIVMVMAASLGKGCIFSALPVAVFQGGITLIAHFAGSFVTDHALNNLSLVGSALIFCVGLNLVWGKKIKVANLLPALIVAVVMARLGYVV